MKNNNIELAGRVVKNISYSKYYSTNFEISGSPKGYELEKIFESPQEHVYDIFHLAKYYYAKIGIIMRVVNIVRDFGVDGFKLSYRFKDEKAKKCIDNYNEKIKINELLRDLVFELALTGNCIGYDRGGKRIDVYPITRIEVSPLIINNKSVLLFKNPMTYDLDALGLTSELRKKIELSYPSEVARGIKEGKELIALNVDNTFHLRTNCSRYEPYGMPFILTAFDELAHKTVLKEAERSTAIGIIDKILKIGVGDKDHAPKQSEIDFYHSMFDGKNGSIKAVVPYFVTPEWIEPDTSIFGRSKFEQVDLDILNALGISLTLIRGEGGGNYSEGFISLKGLIKTIENIREGIPSIIEELYRKELIRNGLSSSHAPKFTFNNVVIDDAVKFEMTQWLFQNAGLPYEVLYDECGYDFLSVKLTRQEENKIKMEDTFKLREQPFQGESAGAPKKNLAERKTDKSKSNNKQPRQKTSTS